jgi:hypothetical protein
MAMANTARFIAAAALTALLTAPQALAAEKMGKLIIVDKVLKGDKKGARTAGAGDRGQTARRPQPSAGGDGTEYGVERPAPEGPDPNAPGAGGNAAGGGDKPPMVGE